MVKGKDWRLQQRQQQTPEPEFTGISLKTKTVKRLKYFGSEGDTYEQVLKLMNVAEGKRRDTVAGEKAWLRDSEECRKLLPLPGNANA